MPNVVSESLWPTFRTCQIHMRSGTPTWSPTIPPNLLWARCFRAMSICCNLQPSRFRSKLHSRFWLVRVITSHCIAHTISSRIIGQTFTNPIRLKTSVKSDNSSLYSYILMPTALVFGRNHVLIFQHTCQTCQLSYSLLHCVSPLREMPLHFALGSLRHSMASHNNLFVTYIHDVPIEWKMFLCWPELDQWMDLIISILWTEKTLLSQFLNLHIRLILKQIC